MPTQCGLVLYRLMSPVKSQVLGLALGLLTALGCIFYEKLVHQFSFLAIAIIKLLETLIIFSIAYVVSDFKQGADAQPLTFSTVLYLLAYMVCGATSILWYVLTKNQGVMAGSLYEIKYIVMLALIYIFMGDKQMSFNTVIGLVLAIGSVYFISKS